MTIDVYDAIAPLAAEWEALAKWAGAPPFARPGWFSAWWHAFATGDLIVVTLTRGGRLVGVLPLRRRAGVLASPTNAHTPAFGPLAEEKSAEQGKLPVKSDEEGIDLAKRYLSFFPRSTSRSTTSPRSACSDGLPSRVLRTESSWTGHRLKHSDHSSTLVRIHTSVGSVAPL